MDKLHPVETNFLTQKIYSDWSCGQDLVYLLLSLHLAKENNKLGKCVFAFSIQMFGKVRKINWSEKKKTFWEFA
jgi:hypothetical protein